jgi:hypothetical protein
MVEIQEGWHFGSRIIFEETIPEGFSFPVYRARVRHDEGGSFHQWDVAMELKDKPHLFREANKASIRERSKWKFV